MYYISKAHRHRFENAIKKNYPNCSKKYYAALYLLYADYDLQIATEQAVQKQSIKFFSCKQSNFTAEQYTLFRAAQDIYTGTNYISIEDLADPGIIDKQIYKAILEALQIARRGYGRISVGVSSVPGQEAGELE